MRNAFAKEILAIAKEDPKVVLLTADIGNNLFNAFKDELPQRFYNCGIAEANMTGVAAGMALAGLKPVTYTIAAFNPGRCVEQIKLDIALHNLPVLIVGVGAGLSYASLGPSHHALEDVAVMRSIPNMSVVCPADPLEVQCALHEGMKLGTPVYIRLGKKGEPSVHQRNIDFKIGKGIELLRGKEVTILSVGTMLPVAMQAADRLTTQGVSTGVVSMHTVKPLDDELLTAHFSEQKMIVVVEEHSVCGGAWSAVSEWFMEKRLHNDKLQAKLLRVACEDSFFMQGGSQQYARECFGLTSDNIVKQVLAQLAS